MKKTLIAALIAGIPAVAAADVTIYGSMRGAFENTNRFGAGSENAVQDYSSRIGFKGSEDLGNGLKAIWKVESAVRLDGSNDKEVVGVNGKENIDGTGIGSREAYLGLTSDYGTLRMGRINNTLNDLGMMDVWEYANGVNGLYDFTRTGERLGNSVRFDSATYYGFSGSIGHSFDESKDEKGQTYFGLNYENGPFAAYYAAQTQEDGFEKADGSLKRAWTHRLEGTYNANNLFIGAGYQFVKGANADFSGKIGGDNLEGKELALTAGYTYGNLTPKITYAKGWDIEQADKKLEDSGYDQWIVGVDYALSKRTTAFTSYGVQKLGDYYKLEDSKIKTFAVGMRHDF